MPETKQIVRCAVKLAGLCCLVIGAGLLLNDITRVSCALSELKELARMNRFKVVVLGPLEKHITAICKQNSAPHRGT